MRGYFAIGVEGISKAHNLGAVLRTGHAFGASFAFTIGATHKALDVRQTDTSRSFSHLPFYNWDTAGELILPKNCQMVGVELTDESVDLPSFRHPLNAAYILGPEKGSLSPDMQARCSHLVKIPTKFCINVSLAAALTLYDRTLSMGGYPDRPVRPGGPGLATISDWKRPSHGRTRSR
jgi:tRNA G18 (ribose-2'-O)-methylase SpoU